MKRSFSFPKRYHEHPRPFYNEAPPDHYAIHKGLFFQEQKAENTVNRLDISVTSMVN